jgi:orotidine-5'-phosphate decarboxylase
MTEPSKAQTPPRKTKDRIIVAFDVETAGEARAIVREIGDTAGAFKIGLQLFTSAGPDFVKELTSSGVRIFLDLKFHDIPNTVAKASVEAAKLGVWMFNIHASGGREMMSAAANAAKEFCEEAGREVPIILGVTVLTSSNTTTLKESGIERNVEDHVTGLARLAAESGLAGVVASPHEVISIRTAVQTDNFTIVTPGIRPTDATNDDQKRVMIPAEAVSAGSDYLVIGRPVTSAADRKGAIIKIIEEIDGRNK